MATLTMVYKLIQSAQKRWTKLRGSKKIQQVWDGIKFEDGIKIRSEKEEFATA